MGASPNRKNVGVDELSPHTGRTTRPLDDLPNEVIVLVGKQLSNKDLATARQSSNFVNKLWSPIFFARGCTDVRSGMMGLEWAVSRNRELIVRRMLETKPDMSTIKNSAGFTPLHIAADQGNVNFVKLLLDAGADFSLQSKSGDTPLHRAAKVGNLEVVRVFLDHTSEKKTENIMDTKNLDGNTPIMLAARGFHRQIVDLFLSCGADTTIQKEPGNTLLHTACELGFPSEVQKLLQAGTVEINGRNDEDNTSLHLAAGSGSAETVKLLLESGADIAAQKIDGEGETPLHMAAGSPSHNVETIKLLLDYGADIEARGGLEQTPLHHASNQDSTNAAKVLLEAGANVHVKTCDSLTPMTLADEEGNVKMIRLLVDAGAEPPDHDWDESYQ